MDCIEIEEYALPENAHNGVEEEQDSSNHSSTDLQASESGDARRSAIPTPTASNSDLLADDDLWESEMTNGEELEAWLQSIDCGAEKAAFLKVRTAFESFLPFCRIAVNRYVRGFAHEEYLHSEFDCLIPKNPRFPAEILLSAQNNHGFVLAGNGTSPCSQGCCRASNATASCPSWSLIFAFSILCAVFSHNFSSYLTCIPCAGWAKLARHSLPIRWRSCADGCIHHWLP